MTKEFKRLLIIIQILLIILYPITPFITLANAQESSASASIAPSPEPTIGPSLTPQISPTPDHNEPAPSVSPLPSPSPAPVIAPLIPPASPTLTPLPTLSLASPQSLRSGLIRQKLSLLPLEKNVFQSKEKIRARLINDYGDPLQIAVRDLEGREIPVLIESQKDAEQSVLTIAPYAFASVRPGKYKLQITDSDGITYEQTFSWGVLAINTNKSVYLPNETASIAIAVLDDMGAMVCDALLGLEIISPSGQKSSLGTWDQTIKSTGACHSRTLTYTPDYISSYGIDSETGSYRMILTAETKNGTRQISDSFEVKNSVPFDVERITATRIFPVNVYDVRLKVKVNEDFTGKITETVPGSYQITKGQSSIAVGFDEIASKSASIGNARVSGLYFTPYSVPFTGFYKTTQSFDEIPENRHLRQEYTRFGLRSHDGIDFAMPVGTPVIAIDNGKVLEAGQGDYGITVILQHAWGKSIYGHLSQTDVEKDQNINAGKAIGLSGNTGLSTGPHLHYAIEPKNPDAENGFKGKVNPLNFLKANEASSDESLYYQELTWNMSLKKGDEIILGYSFDAPDISPQLHFLGPLTFNKEIFVDQAQIALESSPASTPSATLSPTINQDIQNIQTASESSQASPSATVSSGLAFDQTENTGLSLSQNKIRTFSEVFRESRRWQIAVDADVTINNSIQTSDERHSHNPRMVFVSDQIGYFFFADASADLAYVQTTNGGASWSAPTVIYTGTVAGISIWYDRWTPGDISGNYIHIFFGESAGTDEVYYDRIDVSTTSPTELGEYIITSITTGVSDGDSFSITKSTTSILYAAYADGSAGAGTAFVKNCNLIVDLCDADGDWSATTDNLDDAEDYVRIMPLTNGNIMLIRWDISANVIDCDSYNGSTWAGFSTIQSAVPDNSLNRRPWGLVQRRWNKDMFLVYVPNPGTLDTAELITWYYTGTGTTCSGWTQKTDVLDATADISASETLISADVAIDEESGEIYVNYLRGSATVTDLFYKKSTDNMTTWGVQSSALNTTYTAHLNYYAYLNMSDSERIYFAYHESASDDMMGGTIVNLAPPTLDEILKHGQWWSKVGARKTMTF